MNPLNSVNGTIISGIALAVLLGLATMGINFNPNTFLVWIHVLAGVTWIGLLYYFNFVQVPALAEAVSDEDIAPDSYNSSAISQPPINSPPIYSWGNVGQFE